MDSCPRPEQNWPQRVPLKVMGRMGELHQDMVAGLILGHLGPQGQDEGAAQTNCKGAFVSYTFWITVPDAEAEVRLREDLIKLPGYVMQL